LRNWDKKIDLIKEQEKQREAEASGTPYDSYAGSLEGSMGRDSLASDEPKEGSLHKSLERSASKSSVKSGGEHKEDDESRDKELGDEGKGTKLTEQEVKLLSAEEQQDRDKLEWSIKVTKEDYQKLKKENAELQHSVAMLIQNRDHPPTGGDASMNELKYINALVNVTQVRMQMKQTQESYNKMAQDLEEKLQFHQERSDQMKNSFKEFKHAVAESAEFNRTGKKIPKRELDRWDQEEEKIDAELQKENFTYITNKRKLKQVEEELKKKDKLAEGLHVIDFEQLKIENQTLNEKIEERNEAIHNLNTKIRKGVIMFTHMREKLHQLKLELDKLKAIDSQKKEIADKAESDKNEAKRNKKTKEIIYQTRKKKVGIQANSKTKGKEGRIATKWEKIGAPKLVLAYDYTFLKCLNRKSLKFLWRLSIKIH